MKPQYKHNAPVFVCPNDGVLSNDDVAFVCNTCDTTEVKVVDGMYVCPQCFTHIHPFQCRICDSTKVALQVNLYDEQIKTQESQDSEE